LNTETTLPVFQHHFSQQLMQFPFGWLAIDCWEILARMAIYRRTLHNGRAIYDWMTLHGRRALLYGMAIYWGALLYGRARVVTFFLAIAIAMTTTTDNFGEIGWVDFGEEAVCVCQ
jgi:hypothetical protein